MSPPTRISAMTLSLCISLTAFAASTDSTPATPKLFERMLKKWDANHDGRISLEEYLAAATTRFQQIDTRHTGAVDAQQIANSPPALERMQRRAEVLV